MPDRDVRLRTEVTSSGNTEVLRELAQDAEGLEAKVQGAVDGFADFEKHLRDLPSDAFDGIDKEISAMSKALREVGKDNGLEDQIRLADALEQAMVHLRDKIGDAWEDGSDAAKTYERVLDGVRATQAGLADPLVQSYRRAQEAADRAAKAVARGSEEGGTKIAEARFQVEKFSDALEEAKREGRDVGEIGKEFDQVAGRVRGLQQEYARFRAIRERTDREIRDSQTVYQGYGRSVASVDDVLQNLADRQGKFVGSLGRTALKVGVVITVFEQAYRAGERLWRGLDTVAENLFNVHNASDRLAGSINRGFGLTKLAEKIANWGTAQEDVNRRLETNRNILDNLGVEYDRHSSDLSYLVGLVEKHARAELLRGAAIRDTANAFGLLTDSQLADRARQALEAVSNLFRGGFDDETIRSQARDLVQSLLAELDRLPPALAGNIQAMAETLGLLPSVLQDALSQVGELSDGDLQDAAAKIAEQLRYLFDQGIPKDQIKTAFGDSLQSILDEVDRLPPALALKIQVLAETLGVLPSEIEHRGTEIKEALASWGIAVEEEGKTLERRVEIFLEAFKRLSKADLADLDTEAFRGQVQDLVDDLRAAGRDIPDELANIASSVDVVVHGFERATNTQRSFAAAGKEVSDSSIEVVEAVNAQGETVTVVRQKTEAATQAARDSADAQRDQAAAAGEAGSQAEQAGVKVEQAGGKWVVYQDQADGAADSATAAGEAARRGGESAEAGAKATERAAEASEQQAEAASKAGEETQSAAEQLDALTASAERYQEVAGSMAASSREIAEALAALADPGSRALEVLDGLAGVDLSPLRGEVQALSGDVDDLIAKLRDLEVANAAAFALDGGGGGQPATAAPGGDA